MLKILAIGNSFSQDATAFLHKIAKADGFELEVANLYIGGCSLERHWNNILSDAKDYLLEINGVSSDEYVSVREMLIKDDWDFVTMQQVSSLSVDYSTYQPYLKNLSDYVKEYAPNAEQVIHQTWAYEENSERLNIELGYKNQADMFHDLSEAYKKAAKDLGGLKIIQSGQAFQNAIGLGYKNLHRDTFHASIPQGRYLLGAVWYEFFSGNNIENNSYKPEGVDKEELRVLKKAVI